MMDVELQNRQRIIDLLERVVDYTEEVPVILLVCSAIRDLKEMWSDGDGK